ncbi:MAG: nitroreductase/quinone reductase family protein [Acidobacteriota bacterium]
MDQPSTQFTAPSPVDRFINRAFGFLVKIGLCLPHNYLLEVRGRKSGRIYSTPVNLLEMNGTKYIVAPRGCTQWVRNIEASGEAGLVKRGRRQTFRFQPVADEAKPEILSLSRSFQAHRSAILPDSRRFARRSIPTARRALSRF